MKTCALFLSIMLIIVSEALGACLKKVLPSLVTQQTAFVQDRCIDETGKLIYDILEITGTLNLKGYLVTIDTEKAFGSFSHSFLMAVLKKFDFDSGFLEGI